MPERRQKAKEQPDLHHLLRLCLRHRDPRCQDVLERMMRKLEVEARYRLRLRAMLLEYTRRYTRPPEEDPGAKGR